jgi:hypothetical protein
MKITFWRSSGTIDRGPYALVELIGFTLKHNVDRRVATYVFPRPWTSILPLLCATPITLHKARLSPAMPAPRLTLFAELLTLRGSPPCI